MRFTHTTSRHWDGTPNAPHRRRALTVAPDSPNRLLRIAQGSRCQDCGNRIDCHITISHQRIGLHPVEVPAAIVPAEHRWHLASGIALPAGDGSPWCRLAHATLCPAHGEPGSLPSTLDEIRRCLALHTRRLTDTGAFTPARGPETTHRDDAPCAPARPVAQFLYGRYVAAARVEEIRCVAQTVRRHHCTNPVLAPGSTQGRWTLMAFAPHRRGTRRVDPSTAEFAVYDLSHLTYSEQVRWRTQRCPTHAATSGAPDLALADWEPFDPLRHHKFLATRLPGNSHRSK
ncbi:DUF6083 domain-containing protein [Streptomyces sp. NPDC055815]